MSGTPTSPSSPPAPSFNRINFPVYAVSPLSCNHVIVAGGGGAANTGVFNGFAICEVGYEKNGYVIYEVQRHSTGQSAIMNASVGSFANGKKLFLATGKDAECHVYQIKLQPKMMSNQQSSNNSSIGVRQRNRTSSREEDGTPPPPSPQKRSLNGSASTLATELIFDIHSVISAQTDFSITDPCQNTVCFSSDSRQVITGGADGVLRVWNFPEMKTRLTINASRKEISDVDITPDRRLVSCVSKDGKCKIWSVSDGRLVCSLDLPPEDEMKYMYKRSKFGMVEDDKRNAQRLFTILNPSNQYHKTCKSYIQHWTGPSFALTRVAPVGQMLSALAVSKCGRYVATGSMDSGDVDIFIGFNLQRLQKIERAHKTFVTGLSFLPPSLDEDSVLANCDAAVVSISVDNQILIHPIEKRYGVSVWVAVVLVILVLLATFIGCSYIGL